MASSQLNGVRRHLRRAAGPQGGTLTDGQLLERFLAAREEAAFEALLKRHGPMVLGLCRRVLHQEQDAEDAFQATFLILVRKAASVVTRESVGSWLYGVAYRTALKAREATARRRAKEKQMARPEALLPPDGPWCDLRLLIDRELSRLPEKYRQPVVLCDLEGHTQKEAAQRLGWPEGTLSGRLARARALLAKRLARHGLALAGGTVAVALARNAAATVPAPLVGSTLKAATLVAAGNVAAGGVSAPVAALTEGVLKAMGTSQIKRVFAVVLAVGLLGAGWGVYQGRAAEDPSKKVLKQAAPAPIKGGDKLTLPTGPPPIQVLASIGKDRKLVIKTAVFPAFPSVPMAPPGGAVPPVPAVPPANFAPPGAGAGASGQLGWALRDVKGTISQTYDLDEVQILDTRGRKLDKKTVVKRLKQETVAVASLWGPKVDPLHLRVLKDGILVFVLPVPKGIPGVPGIALPGRVVPLPAPVVPPGGPGAGASGSGVAAPATVTSGTPAQGPKQP